MASHDDDLRVTLRALRPLAGLVVLAGVAFGLWFALGHGLHYWRVLASLGVAGLGAAQLWLSSRWRPQPPESTARSSRRLG